MTEANNFPHPERVLVISAHPDDPEFGAGGTIAKWAAKGAVVTIVIVTDGSKGSAEPNMTSEKLVEMRQREERAAVAAMGAKNVEFLGYEDGRVKNTPELQNDIVRMIRLYRPDVLITHDPTARIYGNAGFNHTDHRAVGDTVLDAVYPLARDRLNFPEHEQEGLEPFKVSDIFLTSTDQPNYTVDISDSIHLKIASLREHKSQIGDMDKLEERLLIRSRQIADNVSFEFGEQFRRVRFNR